MIRARMARDTGASLSRSNRTTCWLPATTRLLMVVGRERSSTRPSLFTPANSSSWLTRSAAASLPTSPMRRGLAAQGRHVGGHVAGPPDLHALRAHRHHGHRGLGRDAGDRPPHVLVQHHVPQNQDAAFGKPCQMTEQGSPRHLPPDCSESWTEKVRRPNRAYATRFLFRIQPASPDASRPATPIP